MPINYTQHRKAIGTYNSTLSFSKINTNTNHNIFCQNFNITLKYMICVFIWSILLLSIVTYISLRSGQYHDNNEMRACMSGCQKYLDHSQQMLYDRLQIFNYFLSRSHGSTVNIFVVCKYTTNIKLFIFIMTYQTF